MHAGGPFYSKVSVVASCSKTCLVGLTVYPGDHPVLSASSLSSCVRPDTNSYTLEQEMFSFFCFVLVPQLLLV